MTDFEVLQESWDYQDKIKEAGVDVIGSGFTRGGEYEILVHDPHARRGPPLRLIGREEAEAFLAQIRG